MGRANLVLYEQISQYRLTLAANSNRGSWIDRRRGMGLRFSIHYFVPLCLAPPEYERNTLKTRTAK